MLTYPVGFLRKGEAQSGLVPNHVEQLLFDDREDSVYDSLNQLKDTHPGVGDARPKRPAACADFNGTDQYASVPYTPSLNTAIFSTCFRFKVDTNTGYRAQLFNRDGITKRGYGFYVTSENQFQFWIYDGSSPQKVLNAGLVLSGVWYDVVGIYNGTQCLLYVDGVLKASAGYNYIPQGSRELRIGAGANESVTPSFYYHGMLCDVRCYSDALTFDEVSFIHSNGASGTDPGTVNLVAHYPMQEESGDTHYDISGNGNHATIYNLASGYHATDAGVIKSWPNDEGHTAAFTVSDTLIASDVSGTNNTLTFKIRTTQGSGIAFTKTNSYLFVWSSDTSSYVISAGFGTPTISVDGGVFTGSRNDLRIAVADGEEHAIEVTDVNLTVSGTGLYYGGYPGVFALTSATQIWDLEINGIQYPGPTIIPNVSSTESAIGVTPQYTGEVPMVGLVNTMAWQGDAIDFFVDLKESVFSASGDWVCRLHYFHPANDLTVRNVIAQTAASAASDNRLVLSANGNGAGVLRLFIDDSGTPIAIDLNSLNANEWHDITLARSGDTFTLTVVNEDGTTTSLSQTEPGITIAAESLHIFQYHFLSPYYNEGKISPIFMTIAGVTTTYGPIPGTTYAYKITSDNSNGAVIVNAASGTVTSANYTTGTRWKDPIIENGGWTNMTAYIPASSGSATAVNTLPSNISPNRGYQGLTIDYTGGVLSPKDYALGNDARTAEPALRYDPEIGANKRRIDTLTADRLATSLSDLSSSAYFGTYLSQFAVNGKIPVAAWIPSVDTLGNGSDTLFDLVGSNKGTLTNMDAATDWVLSDGKYALDFAGGNQGVIASGDVVNAERGSISFWLNVSDWNTSFPCVVSNRNIGPHFIELYRSNTAWNFRYGNSTLIKTFSGATLGSWLHIVLVWDATVGTKAWLNGVQVLDALHTWTPPTIDGQFVIGCGDTTPLSQGAVLQEDDIRIWDIVLDDPDATYLYDSGSGRGRLNS